MEENRVERVLHTRDGNRFEPAHPQNPRERVAQSHVLIGDQYELASGGVEHGSRAILPDKRGGLSRLGRLMTRRTILLGVAILACTNMAGVSAQKTVQTKMGEGGSPHVRSEWTVAEATIAIEYGRPYVKGRTIFGGLVPFDSVWRTGADEATTLMTTAPLKIGDVAVPAGTYTLYTLPAEKAWKLIVNTQTGQWGTDYDQKQDLARVDMKLETLPSSVEQLTIDITPQGAGGVLSVSWATTKASIPFSVGK
jgi:hypothetical protein